MAMNTDKQTRAGGAAEGAESLAPLARYFQWTDNQSSVERFIRILTYTCVILFLIDIVWHRYTKVPGEGLWGFYAIIGFVFFCLLVVGSRFVRLFTQREVSFYAPDCVDAEEYPEAGTEQLSHAQRPDDSLLGLGNQMLGREPTGKEQGGASS